MNKCINCGKEFESKRDTAKYCSDKCKKQYLRSLAGHLAGQNQSLAGQKEAKVSGTKVSGTIPEGSKVVIENGVKSITDKEGYKICNVCGRRIIDIKEQWVNPDMATEKDAKFIDRCILCVNRRY